MNTENHNNRKAKDIITLVNQYAIEQRNVEQSHQLEQIVREVKQAALSNESVVGNIVTSFPANKAESQVINPSKNHVTSVSEEIGEKSKYSPMSLFSGFERRLNLDTNLYSSPSQDKKQLSLKALLDFHGDKFIQNAYRTILGRNPDPTGFENFTEKLKTGQLSKVLILAALRFSPEGKRKSVKIEGLLFPLFCEILYKIPVLGYFFRLVATVLNLPRLISSVKRIEERLSIQSEQQVYNNSEIEVYLQEAFSHMDRNFEMILRKKYAQKSDSEKNESLKQKQIVEEKFDYIKQLLNNKVDCHYVEQQFKEKANIHEVEQKLSEKANIHEIEQRLRDKVSVHEMELGLKDKAGIEDLERRLRNKVDICQVEKQLSEKANIRELEQQLRDKADICEVEKQLSEKANIRELEQQLRDKADTCEVEKQLSEKANIRELEKQLRDKANIDYIKQVFSEKANVDYVRQVLNEKADKGILEQKLSEKTSLHHFESFQKDQMSIREDVACRLQSLEEVTKHCSTNLSESFNDSYVHFENRFRGSRDQIKARQRLYLELVQQRCKDSLDAHGLDIGCGRGEWLELLKEQDIRVLGIDKNSKMIEVCRQMDLPASEIGALDYLQNTESNSHTFITGFHIVEHVQLSVLIQLLKEAFRTLRHGGLLIFETPNAKNIFVGSCDFYLDPTHVNPIHPLTLQFLVKQAGFDSAEIVYVGDRLINDRDYKFDDINAYINVPRDYAVIGKKA